MKTIKDRLKVLVQEIMIPECESYLEELLELLESKKATLDDMEAIKEMEDFLVELQNILEAIEQDKINDDEAQEVYDKIDSMLKEHENEHL